MTDDRTAPPDQPYNRWSYQNSSEIGRRPVGEYVYVLALLVAAGADAAAFYVIVSLATGDEGTNETNALIVAGLTVIALMLAHLGGRVARDAAAANGRLRWQDVVVCGVPWALLGVAAMVVRLRTHQTSGGIDLEGGGSSGQEADQVAAALLFLVLYVASGVLAGVGEFLTRNPLRTAYRSALRTMKSAQRKLRRSQPPYERALSVRQLHLASYREDEALLQNAKFERIAFGEELKQLAQISIAAHLQDPSATDGMTERDWRPAAPRPARSWEAQNNNLRTTVNGRRRTADSAEQTSPTNSHEHFTTSDIRKD